MAKNASVRTSDVINYTLGRATNDDLEATVAVWFKDEDEDDEGRAIGPVWLQVAGVSPSEEEPLGGPDRQLVPFAISNGPEWHTVALATALADELGVGLVRS